MTNGTFNDFLDALRAFESGWDRERYKNGVIAEWQLDQWAGGPVTDFYLDYSRWGDLNDAEWDAMSYRSMNSLGFVGYQFGEALLIDLGYYQDDFYYGNGAASNTWDGFWTGKDGVNSLEDFMTASAQDAAIQRAFGYNLSVIETGLAAQGQSLEDYLGTDKTYIQNGQEVTVTLTLTGLLAAAHLRGAWGTMSLLQQGTVTTDEYGTSILRYVDQFGGFGAPSIEDLISVYADDSGPTGGSDEPPDPDDQTNDDNASDVSPPFEPPIPPVFSENAFSNSDISAQNASVAIDWQWGRKEVITGFDPQSDTLFIAWIGAASLEFTEANGVWSFRYPRTINPSLWKVSALPI